MLDQRGRERTIPCFPIEPVRKTCVRKMLGSKVVNGMSGRRLREPLPKPSPHSLRITDNWEKSCILEYQLRAVRVVASGAAGLRTFANGCSQTPSLGSDSEFNVCPPPWTGI